LHIFDCSRIIFILSYRSCGFIGSFYTVLMRVALDLSFALSCGRVGQQ
jgi:hypothetical protein